MSARRILCCLPMFSETFSHFFGPDRDASEDYLELDDRGLVVAEITLEADESGLLYSIADLNCKHIQEVVLDKCYSSHRVKQIMMQYRAKNIKNLFTSIKDAMLRLIKAKRTGR